MVVSGVRAVAVPLAVATVRTAWLEVILLLGQPRRRMAVMSGRRAVVVLVPRRCTLTLRPRMRAAV